MSFLPLDTLKAGAYEIGIELSDEQLDTMDAFAEFMVKTNSKFNITRITEPAVIVTNHFLDSLLCLSAVEFTCEAAVIDIGSGPGFPGIALKLARPDLCVTLVDATQKKARFLAEAARRLNLTGIDVIHGRAECLAHEERMRERYDFVCTRALAELRVVCELCLPFARIGGRLIALKSEDIDTELNAARPITGRVGGQVEKIARSRIPGTDIQRSLVVVIKVKPTPRGFPRAYQQIVRAKRMRY